MKGLLGEDNDYFKKMLQIDTHKSYHNISVLHFRGASALSSLCCDVLPGCLRCSSSDLNHASFNFASFNFK